MMTIPIGLEGYALLQDLAEEPGREWLADHLLDFHVVDEDTVENLANQLLNMPATSWWVILRALKDFTCGRYVPPNGRDTDTAATDSDGRDDEEPGYADDRGAFASSDDASGEGLVLHSLRDRPRGNHGSDHHFDGVLAVDSSAGHSGSARQVVGDDHGLLRRDADDDQRTEEERVTRSAPERRLDLNAWHR